MRRPRPLDPIRSLKAKWSIVIVAAVAVSAATSQIGLYLGWPVWVRPVVAGSLALAAVQVLAHGMILPLREMAVGAAEMRRGLYGRRVEVSTRDEIGQLVDAFNQMAADLAEADRLQKEFVANASHEMRTPVAALRGQIENLSDGVVAASPELLATMLAQAEHLSKLVAQLLDLSRLEAGWTSALHEACDLELLLSQVVEEAQLLSPDAAVSVEVEGEVVVEGDDARLHQLFTNLLGNALRFTPDGEKVAITARMRGTDAVVELADRGPGIAPEDRTRVFERFWQADGSGPTGGGGAGLGLALCKRIVDRHRGSIELGDNEPGGTRVTVVLPVAAPDHEEDIVTDRSDDPGGPDEQPDRAGATGLDPEPAPPIAPVEEAARKVTTSEGGMDGAVVGGVEADDGAADGTADAGVDAHDRAHTAATVPAMVGAPAWVPPSVGATPPSAPAPPTSWPGLPPPPVGVPPRASGPQTALRVPSPLPELRGGLMAAILVAAVFSGLAVQIDGASLALALASVALVGILVVSGAVTEWSHRVASGLIVASGALFALRMSPWITTVEVLSVCGLAWLLAIGGISPDRPRSWLMASGESFINLFDWVPWWNRSLSAALARRNPERQAAPAIRAAIIAGVVVLCLGSLLASGDAVFGHLVASAFGGSWLVRLLIILCMVVPASILALTASRQMETTPPQLRAFRVEALSAQWATAALLGVWCVIQVVVALGGAETVLEAEGVTVADYARQGFFQLVAVAAISLAVVHLAHRVGGGDVTPVTVIGIELGMLVVISFSRLVYYMEVFGLTMLRLSVATFLVWLGVMTLASVVRSWGVGAGRDWLPTAAVLTAGALAVVYGFADPEGFVVRTNLQRAEADGGVVSGSGDGDRFDALYLTELSDDGRLAAAAYDWAAVEGGMPLEVRYWICDDKDDVNELGLLGWNHTDLRAADLRC